MAYRIVFDNIAWRPWSGVAVTTNVSTANSPAGFRVAKAFDGSKLSVWKVQTAHASSVIAIIDRGATQPLELDYPLALGLFNHNIATVGGTLIEMQRSASAGGPWTDLFEVDPSGDANRDMLYESNQLIPGERYLRIVINFSGGGGPSADLTIGQLYFGKLITFADDELPYAPLDSPYTFGASIDRSVGGGRAHRGRAFREQALSLSFQTASLTAYKALINRQKGAIYPIGIHTHRHTGVNAWDDTRSETNLDGAGGGYYAQIDTETLDFGESNEGLYDFALPLVRHMTESET